jgi:hypothetical protein
MKLIIASILVFSVVILFLFALFPTDVSVTRRVLIRSSREQVYKKIDDMREWDSWNEFLVAAFDKKIYTLVKTDSIHIHRESVMVEVVRATPDSVLTYWEHGKKSFTGNFVMTEMNGQVMLEWTLYFHLRWYPWEKLASMFYERQLGPVMEKSLVNLQKELEKQ